MSLGPTSSVPATGMTVEVLHDVTAVPGSHALYDHDGSRIDRSQTWLGGRPRGPRPDRLPDVERPSIVHEPVIFAGLFPKPHFGHVLLEMFTRLWVLDADVVGRGLSIAYLTHRSRPLEPFERQLLDAALAGSGSRTLPIDRPIRFRELHLPTQAVVLGQPFDRAILPLYDRIRERLVGDVRPDDRPLHLSRVRARDPLRRTLGEVALDRRLDAAGVRVLHPQELALPDQIRLVASARTVSGLNGSALHLTVLRDLPDARTISIDPRTPFAVQREVDRLRGARFLSLHAQYPLQPRLPGGRTLEVGAHRNFIAPGSTARRLRAMIEG